MGALSIYELVRNNVETHVSSCIKTALNQEIIWLKFNVSAYKFIAVGTFTIN